MKKTIKVILEKQTKKGLFPTYRAKKGDAIIESTEARIDNIGIHTFVLEKLIQLQPENPSAQTAFQKGLDYLIGEAINQNGRFVWRWLKHPLKDDWLYPADADDTARARTVIELAKTKGFQIPKEFRDFDYSEFINEGLTPLGGRLTFIGFKPDDSLCPIVNINLLHSFRLHLITRGKDIVQNPAYKKIMAYLKRTVETNEFQSSDFTRCSKFYLSHNLLAYLISEVREIFDDDTLLKVRSRIERDGGEYSNPLEASLGTSALINLNGNRESIRRGLKQIEGSILANGLWAPSAFYQHQRSGSIFGSSAGTSIFCLEALSKDKPESE